MRTFAFIDASNLFYGGRKSLGWSIDFEKLFNYLQNRFQVSNIYYFGGIEIHAFHFDYLLDTTVSLVRLEKYLIACIDKDKHALDTVLLYQLERHLKQVRFYQKLEDFGFRLILKPVKTYVDDEGAQKRKANCDVEMAFNMMRKKDVFDRVIVLSGDGDFLPVLKYLRSTVGKEVLILSRGPRTAKEIKQFAGDKFIDLISINMRQMLERSLI
jgi:uncharacterized LabA/DUF88 family protein